MFARGFVDWRSQMTRLIRNKKWATKKNPKRGGALGVLVTSSGLSGRGVGGDGVPPSPL